MRRIQFIELHEQPWFPSSLRDEITNTLQFGVDHFEVYAPIAPLLQRVLDSTGSRSIVDICSGGGGPWLSLSRRLQGDGQTFHICLTDKYPNLRAFQNVRATSENYISFYPDSVDAMRVPGANYLRDRSPAQRVSIGLNTGCHLCASRHASRVFTMGGNGPETRSGR